VYPTTKSMALADFAFPFGRPKRRGLVTDDDEEEHETDEEAGEEGEEDLEVKKPSSGPSIGHDSLSDSGSPRCSRSSLCASRSSTMGGRCRVSDDDTPLDARCKDCGHAAHRACVERIFDPKSRWHGDFLCMSCTAKKGTMLSAREEAKFDGGPEAKSPRDGDAGDDLEDSACEGESHNTESDDDIEELVKKISSHKHNNNKNTSKNIVSI
jgi:hypothetical protein